MECASFRSNSFRRLIAPSSWWTCSCPRTRPSTATKDASARLDKLLKDDRDVDHWSTYVGQGAVRFYLPLNVQLPNDFFAQAVVVTKGLEQRERVKAKLEKALAADFPNAVGRVYPLELGPPVGWPLQYRVSGREPDEVRKIASHVAELVGSAPGAANVNYNWMEPGRTIKIQVDQDQARLLGLSSQELALAVNAVVSGVTATEMRSGIWLDDVLVRASADQRMSLSTIRTLQVPLSNGKTVPLSQIASVEYGQEYPIVWRRDRLPTVTVQADLAPGTQAATVVQSLKPQIAALNASLPSGYHVSVGGSVEESDKAQASVIAVVPLMLVIMLTVLMVQLQSFSSMILVMSVAPMGVIGVVAALLLADKPLGFVAILGVLALTGMIARNSVILINQIETDKAKGLHPWDAVVEATSHRVRPILLTASAAILGMIPIAPTIFWGPMAYAIMGGLAGATVLTLVFLPALYVAWFRIKRPNPDASPSIPDILSRPPAAKCRPVKTFWRTHERRPALLSPVSALLGALIGGGASACAAIYTQRSHDRLQRIAAEVAKREAVDADFVMSASNILIHAFTHDDFSPGGDEQHMIGLLNRMRLFAPANVVGGAEAVLRAIVEVALKPASSGASSRRRRCPKAPFLIRFWRSAKFARPISIASHEAWRDVATLSGNRDRRGA